MKIAMHIHSPSSIKEGLKISVLVLKPFKELLQYYLPVCTFLEKLGLEVTPEVELFYYVAYLNSALLYTTTREDSFENELLGYLSHLASCSTNRFINNCYILILGLMHTGEKSLAFKSVFCIIEKLSSYRLEFTTTHVAILELSVKLCYEMDNYYGKIKKLFKQAIISYVNEENLLKIVDSYCKVHLRSVSILLQHGGIINQYLKTEDILGLALNFQPNIKEKLLERELTNYRRHLIYTRKTDARSFLCYMSSIIELIISELLIMYSQKPSDYCRVLLKYIEVAAICQRYSIGVHLNDLDERIDRMIETGSLPVTYLWRCIMQMNRIKESEEENYNKWIATENAKLYVKSVQNLHDYLKAEAKKHGFVLSHNQYCWERITTLSIRKEEIIETIRNLSLASDISKLIQLTHFEIMSVHLIFSLLGLIDDYDAHDIRIRLECMKLRLSILLYEQGELALANLFYTEKPFAISFTENDVESFQTDLWVGFYQSYWEYLHGKLFKSSNLCKRIIDAIQNSHSEYKKIIILKCECYLLLAKNELLNGQLLASFKYSKHARICINDLSSKVVKLQNLSFLNGISENAVSLYKDECNIAKTLRCIVFPHSPWALQSISSSLILHLGNLYIYRSEINSAVALYTKGATLGKILGIPSIFLLFHSLLCNLERHSLLNPLIYHENIQQKDLKDKYQAINFIENIQNVLIFPLLETKEYSEHSSLHHLTFTSADLDYLTFYLNRKILCETMLTLGDIIQTPRYSEQIPTTVEHNYYKLAKSLLLPKFENFEFSRLNGIYYLKQACLIAKQTKSSHSINVLYKSINSFGCCANFYKCFMNNTTCCRKYYIYPHTTEDLSQCLLILSDYLLKRHEISLAYSILTQLSNLPQINHPTTKRHINYLLSRNIELSQESRAYYNCKSVGVSYSAQFDSIYKGSNDIISPEDLFSLINSFPPEWSIVCLSVGRGTFNDGISISKLTKDFTPFTATVGGKCICNSSKPLSNVLEEFTEIMKQSARTTAKSDLQISSNAWWKTRQQLNDALEDWLASLQNRFLKEYSVLFLGRILNRNVETMIFTLIDELKTQRCPHCNEEFNETFLYFLISGLLTADLTLSTAEDFFHKVKGEVLIEKVVQAIKGIKMQETIRRGPVVLLIDGNLMHLPWESMPVLKHQEVSRIPSIRFIQQRLPPAQIRLENSFYILNPSNDLESTQKQFESYFSSHKKWSGIVQTPPTESEFSQALENYDLLVYCGHSAGEQYIKGETVKKLSIKSLVLLMGCSSGLLRNKGQFEPQGIVIQYLIGGSPCVIANLWDVTDRDIDRFSLKLLKQLEKNRGLSQSMRKARETCKLKQLIGAAPVIYGLPAKIN